MLSKDDIKELLNKHRSGLCSEEELQIIEYLIFNKTKQIASEKQINSSKKRIKKVVFNLVGLNPQIKFLLRFLIGAAAFFTAVLTVFYLNHRSVESRNEIGLNEIRAGYNQATLVIADGKTIQLKNNKDGIVIHPSNLTYNDGSPLSSQISSAPNEKNKTNGIGELMLRTPNGGQYQIILSDGTKVWLNNASILKFPDKFTGLKNRRVWLEGEAYFEVAKDKKHPFLVQTRNQEVKVLGTHFNIKAYHDEKEIRTTLLEGSVKVTLLNPSSDSSTDSRLKYPLNLFTSSLQLGESRGMTIKPNQQAVLVNQEIRVSEVNASEVIAWKNGYFRFDGDNIQTVMREFARWYNIDVVYVGGIPNGKFRGQLAKNKNLGQVLNILNLANIEYRLEGRRLIIQTD